MTKTLKFTLTSAWILLSRGYDAYCTSQFTPDLSREANPLVTVLGLTWTPLLLTVGALTLYSLYAYYLATFKRENLLPSESGWTFSNVAAYAYLGRKTEWPAIFYQLPRELWRFNQYTGHVLPRFLAFAGVVSTLMWLLIHHADFYKKIHSPALVYSILILGCVGLAYQWNRTLFRKYLFQNQ